MRVCQSCQEGKSPDSFRTPRSRKCRACIRVSALARQARYREQHREALRVSYSVYYYANIKSRYGMTRAQFEQRLTEQGSACAVCRAEFTPDSPAQVDHDHSCCDLKKRSCGGCIRGLVCRTCNLGLSYFRDSPTLLRDAAAYLETTEKEPVPHVPY